MPSNHPRLHHYNGTGVPFFRIPLKDKLLEDEFGFTLDVAGIVPVNLQFHFGELERVLKKVEGTMPKPLRGLPWLDQVESVVRELEPAGDDEQNGKP